MKNLSTFNCALHDAMQKYEKEFKEKRTFPGGLKEIEHLYDVGRSQVNAMTMVGGADSYR